MRPARYGVPLLAIGLWAGLCVGLCVGLWGCSTPRYQTLYRYDPPITPSGRICLEKCDQTLRACLNNCQENYTACVQSIEPEAEARYNDALKRYAGEWSQYQRDLDHYHLSFSLGWWHGGGWYGQGWYDPWWPYGGYWPPYYPPQPPQLPSYADELRKLSVEKCNRDCGCQPLYDACFLECGGMKVPEQRCITNCPP